MTQLLCEKRHSFIYNKYLGRKKAYAYAFDMIIQKNPSLYLSLYQIVSNYVYTSIQIGKLPGIILNGERRNWIAKRIQSLLSV